MQKRNYKVFAQLGTRISAMYRYLAVLDTGAGPNVIRSDALPPGAVIKPHKTPPMRGANGRPLQTVGVTTLHVRVGTEGDRQQFIVCEQLAVDVILGCQFCDQYVEAIRPRDRTVVLNDRSVVPIEQMSISRAKRAAQGKPEAQSLATPKKENPDIKLRVSRPAVIQPGTQAWVNVQCPSTGVIYIEPRETLYERQGCIAANGVAQVKPRQQFRILVANFSEIPQELRKGQVVAYSKPHPEFIVDTSMNMVRVLGVHDNADVSAPVRSMKRVAKENKAEYLARSVQDLHEKQAKQPKEGEEEKPMTADEVDLSGVDEKYHAEIRRMLHKHASMWSGKLGEINTTRHAIDLKPGSRPSAVPPYRAGPKTRELEKAEVERQLKEGVIEPAQSEWASPVVFAPKGDGTLRFCVDYRRLNEATLKDSYPIPKMDECIDSLGDAKIFSTLDCNAGYWQILLREEDREKTTFTCHAGTYQYIRMPFGLTNAPATFQRTLDILLSKFKWQSCLVYLDDVIIYSNSVEEHIQHVDAILSALKAAGVSLKLKKCSFFTDKVKYLGHIIRPGTLELDPASTASLRKALPPRNQSEVRSFLGMCNVFKRFIPKYSDTTEPINALLRTGMPETIADWGEKQEKAFRTLIEAICSPPILRLPRRNLPYSVDTDASNYQVGCALFQTDEEGARHPIGFWSRTLQGAERNYSTAEKECLAVVWALQTLRPYLAFEKFVVHTDHAALRWLFGISEPSGRLMRWRLRLAEFDFSIEYKKGKINCLADSLSRLLTEAGTEYDPEEDTIPIMLLLNESDEDTADNGKEFDFIEIDYVEDDFALATEDASNRPSDTYEPITWEELIREQASDELCTRLRQRLTAGEDIPFVEDPRGVLIRTSTRVPQIVVPQSLRARLLHASHYARMAGHPGGRKLYYKLRRHFYWPAMALDAYNTVRQCATCARNRIKLRKHSSTLKLFPAKAPLEFIAIDLLGELIKTPRGNRYLLVMTDRYSKLTRVVPLRNIKSDTVAKAFVNHWVLAYGPPTYVLTDNGGQFAGKFFADVCRIVGAANLFTTTYHPQCNGQVERYNSTIVRAMRHYIADHPKNWDLYAETLTFAYNRQPHTSTGIAPFELVVSNPPGPPGMAPDPTRLAVPPAEYRLRWKQWLSHLMHTTDERLTAAQERYKRGFDNLIRPLRLALRKDNYAFLRADRPGRDSDNRSHKLAPLVTGPHLIREVSDDGRTIVLDLSGKDERVSRDRVVPAPSPPSQDWTPSTAALQPHHTLWPAPVGFNLAQVAQPETESTPSGVLTRFSAATNVEDLPTVAQYDEHEVQDDDAPVQRVRDTDDVVDTTAPEPPSTDATIAANGSTSNETQHSVPLGAQNEEPAELPAGTTVRPNATSTTQTTETQHAVPARDSRHLSPHARPVMADPSTPRIAADGQASPARTMSTPSSTTEPASSPDTGSSSSPEQPPTATDPPVDSDLSQRQPRHLEYVIDRIITHEVADGSEPEYEAGTTYYRVRWLGFDRWDDTWEPITHLPRSAVQRYYRRIKQPLPADIQNAMVGAVMGPEDFLHSSAYTADAVQTLFAEK